MPVYLSSNPNEWFQIDGTYLSEEVVSSGPEVEGSNVTQIVGVFPWGPVDTLTRCSDTSEFLAAFVGPTASPAAWAGVRSMIGKRFGICEIVRVDATGAVAASRTVDADGYTVTARYKSAAGNQITVKHTDKTGGVFDVTIQWGTYVKTYAGLTLATVAAVSDPYVVFATTGAGDTVAASDSAAVALAGGSDGTPVDADYTGGVSDVSGLRLFESGSEYAGVFVAEYTSAAVLSALAALAAITKGEAFGQGAADLTDQDAANTAAAAISDDLLMIAGHGVLQTIDGVQYTVHLAPFLAALRSQSPPHYSIAMQRYADQLNAIDGVPAGVSLGRAAQVAAEEAGAVSLERLPGGQHKVKNAIMSDGTRLSLRRARTVSMYTIAEAALVGGNAPDMPYFERATIGAMREAIRVLKSDPDNTPEAAIIEDADVRRASGAPANSVIYIIAVKHWQERRSQILRVVAGDTVDVTEVMSGVA